MKSLQIPFEESDYKSWKKIVDKVLKETNLQTLSTQTLESIELKPYYDNSFHKLFQKQVQSLPLFPRNEKFLQHINHFIISVENSKKIQGKENFVFCSSWQEVSEVNENCTIVFDIFSHYEKFGQYSVPLKNLQKSELFPKITYWLVDTSLHQNAGANSVEQIAFSLLKLQELVSIFGREILSKIAFKTAIGSHFLMEISKLKALQHTLHKVYTTYEVGEANPIIFAETSYRNKTSLDVENNLIRSTYEALAAMIGGANFVTINPYKNFENPTDYDLELALKQFMLLQHESYIAFFENASEGSYAIENLTHELAQSSWELFQDLDLDGYSVLLENETIKKIVTKSHQKEQKHFDNGNIKLVGVNISKSNKKTFEIAQSNNTYLIPKRLAKKSEL